MSESKIRPDYGTLQQVVKGLRAQGMSKRAIENVLRFYGVEI